ncbi:MAG: alpha/beta hydrolase [Gammaproteobacteria bacterium]|nr:alpha/beta hydrolase [Gammaproteobacteria bacterium]NNF50364.1 alpha/beta fold hydrolase [Woeseiaceae bacterium]MBT8094781.1 alpha/beta hydrolase [Gammaproteobacteria bacterium]MBT8104052.1 alpha/beta hydrolase [Gammaproteobacteria bacterium]NNK24067.1 alpha/beta fold hydrolase [Woeseiaceae bacterium]
MTTSAARLLFPALLLLAQPVISGAEPLELEECRISIGPGSPGTKARCGTMLRPENPDDSGSPQIRIRVAVVPALNLSPATDAIVPIAGGPGQGTVEFYLTARAAFEPLRRDRDILLVDQRGTGESATMDCPIDDEALLFETEFGIEEIIAYTAECLDSLPHDPRWFTTSVAVTDLEAVRAALGYTALNLYGVSYGSRVAQHFARRYPEVTRSVIIDGVVPPQISLGPEIATMSQKAVDNILARCAQDEACAAAFPDIDATFARVVAELREAPVEVTAPHPNTGRMEAVRFGIGQFAGAVRLLVYNANTIALLPLLVHEAGQGNFGPLASQFMLTAIAMRDALAIGMHNSVMCTEDVPFIDRASVDRESIEASYMGAFQLETLEAMCEIWPSGPLDPEFKVPVDSDIPFLLLSGDADPITPPRYAEMAAVDLRTATHLIGKQQGHGQIVVGCMGRIVSDFVDTRDPLSLDTACMERSFVTPFFLDFSGPAP